MYLKTKEGFKMGKLTYSILLFLMLTSMNIIIVFGHSKQATLDQLYEIRKLDDDVCRQTRRLYGAISTSSKLGKDQSEGVAKSIHVAGSIAEGGCIARLFGKNDEFESGVNREVEIDIEYVLTQMTGDMTDQCVDITDKIGYVKVKSSTQLLTNARKSGWKVSNETVEETLPQITSEDGWFKPYKIKSVAKQKVEFKDPQGLVQIIFAAAMKVKKKDARVLYTGNEVTKSSVASDFMFELRGQNYLRVSFDTVPLIKISWYPSFVTEWKNRQRKWPSPVAVEDLLADGGYLIAKPSVEEKYNEDSTEMRYAFAHVERKLIQLRTEHQNFIYLIFKIMITKWVKPIDVNQISSFVGKTVMFWLCEEYPPEHEVWGQDYDSIAGVLTMLFRKLLASFEDGNLPYYFNEKVNVIESVTMNNRRKVMTQINEILADVGKFLPINADKELKAGREILETIKSVIDVMEEFIRKDFTRLLNQPELIIDALKMFIDKIDWDEIGKKVERELKRVGKQVEAEAKRFGKKVEAEVKRSGDKVAKEVERFGKKVEAEVKRVGDKVGDELKRFGKRFGL